MEDRALEQLFAAADVIVIDELPMLGKHAVEVLLEDLSNMTSFGKKVIITLPVSKGQGLGS